jgi:hypothetical protein
VAKRFEDDTMTRVMQVFVRPAGNHGLCAPIVIAAAAAIAGGVVAVVNPVANLVVERRVGVRWHDFCVREPST